MQILLLYLVCLLSSTILMCVVFLTARKIKRFDLVDAAWGMAFIAIAVTSYILNLSNTFELNVPTVTTLLVIIWGVRLSRHILKRIAHSTYEDERYVELRKKWKGNVELNVLFRIYIMQAVLAFVICLPVIYINLSDTFTWSWVSFVGVIVWSAGFLFESISDWQLRNFVTKPSNKGKIMTEGLWRYSRHPNYFGELMQWWGIFIVCLSVPLGWINILGPLLLTYLILFVSGIPLNEKRFEGRRGWKEYRQKTSRLIPLLPH